MASESDFRVWDSPLLIVVIRGVFHEFGGYVLRRYTKDGDILRVSGRGQKVARGKGKGFLQQLPESSWLHVLKLGSCRRQLVWVEEGDIEGPVSYGWAVDC